MRQRCRAGAYPQVRDCATQRVTGPAPSWGIAASTTGTGDHPVDYRFRLVQAGAFPNVGPGRSIRVELADVQQFIATTRRVDPHQWPANDLFRVSLLPLHDDPMHDITGTLLRTQAGADYHPVPPISNSARDRAFLGVWDVADATANRAKSTSATLFGTTKGYIHPFYVRQIIDWRRDHQSGRIWWKTIPADPSVMQFVGTGLWMPVKPGRESDWA